MSANELNHMAAVRAGLPFREKDETQRTCRVCGIIKPITYEFFSSVIGKKPGQSWFSRRCRLCDAASSRARWAADPARCRKLDKACRDAKREQIRAYDRMRVVRDREKKLVIITRWLTNNPERARALSISRSARRRARIAKSDGSWNADDVARMEVAQHGKCWWCPKLLNKKWHVDHRIPLAKGGSNFAANLVLSCAECNRKKSAKMPWEFSGRLL